MCAVLPGLCHLYRRVGNYGNLLRTVLCFLHNYPANEDEDKGYTKIEKANMKTIVKINIRWDSLKSIERAEKDKATLEDKGYTKIEDVGGVFESSLIYAKEG